MCVPSCCEAIALTAAPPHVKKSLSWRFLTMMVVSSLTNRSSFASFVFSLWDRPETSVLSGIPNLKNKNFHSKLKQRAACADFCRSRQLSGNHKVLDIYVKYAHLSLWPKRSDSALRDTDVLSQGMCQVFSFITERHSSSFWNISSPCWAEVRGCVMTALYSSQPSTLQ